MTNQEPCPSNASLNPQACLGIKLGRRCAVLSLCVMVVAWPFVIPNAAQAEEPLPLDTTQMLVEYFEQLSVAKPILVRTGSDWSEHRRELQEYVLDCAGLKPLPERVPLNVQQTPTLDHPWCTVRRVHYQLWPGVYSAGLLFMPKQLSERPAPAVLCPHGHWQNGNAHPEVQKRCLNLARLGYVTFSSTQNHYEDLAVGVSHQTLMIWNNVRALDYLESLPEVDKSRIGVAGASGGGLQTQMLTALDARVKAATIVGLTCDFREIMFPDSSHCVCNHFPNILRRTDHPEISTLGLPAAVQFLTMNDWTRNFEAKCFPGIQKLYAAHGCGERVFCRYFDTEHNYDRTKRESTYWWMQRWLRGKQTPGPEGEPETSTFPADTLVKLTMPVPDDKGFAEIGRIYRTVRGYSAPTMTTEAEWQAYHTRMIAALKWLLGVELVQPRTAAAIAMQAQPDGELLIQHVAYPSEGGMRVPSVVLRPKAGSGALPVVVLLTTGAKDELLAESGADSPRNLARNGSLVVLPDLRTYGALFATSKNPARQAQAWERNGIVWGRPVPGMAVTDLRGVLDGMAARPDVDPARVKVTVRGSGELAIAALFAAALDARIAAADLDFAGGCFEKRNLPLVSSVLQHGDVLQWAALAAKRKLVLRNVPAEAGDPDWLRRVFATAGNPSGLQVNPR